ncbi:aspartyl protease family protein [Hymenobacter koreensis]
MLLPLLAEGQSVFQFHPQRRNSVRMPFQLERNLVVVPVQLNGRGPYYFMLDTGADASIITDPTLRETLGLRIGQQYMVAGVGEEAPLTAFQTDGVKVELGDGKVVAPNMSMLLLSADVFNLSSYVGLPVHGILGSDVFRNFVVEIQPENRTITFTRPEKFRRPWGRRWARLPITIEGSKAYVETKVTLLDSVEVPLRLVLDTGAGHALSLETGSDARIKLPPQRLRTLLGRGLSGEIHGYLGRVSGLYLGQYRVKFPITSFPDEQSVRARVGVPRNGNLGFELLKRFHVVIDYPHNQLLLRPNSLYRDPFEHDMCGIDLLATGGNYRRYIIKRVEAGSPAAAANLQLDDEIISINLVPANTMSLTQIGRLLHSADGRQLFLLVRRTDGEMVVARIKLKRQI